MNSINKIWLPYTIQTMAATWSGTINLSKSITSRYRITKTEYKNEIRKRKIKNILKQKPTF